MFTTIQLPGLNNGAHPSNNKLGSGLPHQIINNTSNKVNKSPVCNNCLSTTANNNNQSAHNNQQLGPPSGQQSTGGGGQNNFNVSPRHQRSTVCSVNTTK